MTSTTQRGKKPSTDSLSNDVAARIGHVIGIDLEHCAHVYYPAANTFRVYDVGLDYEVGDYIDTTHRAPAFGGSQ
jgi:hypothetical protein